MKPFSPFAEMSTHRCLIYDGHPSEQLPTVMPALLDALGQNWRCLYLGPPEMLRMAEADLRDRGVDIAAETARGALVLSDDRSHLVDGKFVPGAMIETLSGLVDQAVRDGFKGVWASGDMGWELGSHENAEKLLEYEALLEQLCARKPMRGICQYHRNTLPTIALEAALLTHRSTYLGRTPVHQNFFFSPPQTVLERPARQSGQVQREWMGERLVAVLDSADTRANAAAAWSAGEGGRRAVAEQLAEVNHLVETRVAERTADLLAAKAELETFSYSVSHDLRAPLRAIDQFSRVLEEKEGGGLSEDSRRYLGRIRAGVRHMQDLVDGLLALSRVAHRAVQRERVDLTKVAEGIVADLRASDSARSVEVVIQRGLSAEGDPALLRNVMANLIGNAWKFTARRPDARIEVGAEVSTEGPRFFVRDNGAGFNMKYADQLFAPFQRFHADGEFPGTGVGLATVQRIIQRHGGRVWAESAPGEGATFRFTVGTT